MFSWLKKKNEIQKDFARKDFTNPIMEFWELFEENPQYTLLRYEHIPNGIRAIYSENKSP